MGVAQALVDASSALLADAGRRFAKARQDISEIPSCFDGTAAKLQACSDTEAAESAKCDSEHAARLATCNAIQCTSFTNCSGPCDIQCTAFTNCSSIQCTSFTNCDDFWPTDPRRYACYVARAACVAEKAAERGGCFALRAACVAAAAAAKAACIVACQAARAACVAAAAAARGVCIAGSVVVLGACKGLAAGKSLACKAGVVGSEVVCAAGKVLDAAVNVVIGVAEGIAAGVIGTAAQVACFVESLNPKPGPIVDSTRSRPLETTERRSAFARSFSLATDLCLDPGSPYDEEGVHLAYELTSAGAASWSIGGAPPTSLDFDARDLPPFAGTHSPGPLSVSYDEMRLGDWPDPPRMEMIAAGSDRAIAKRTGTDDVFILVTGSPYAHRVAGECVPLPQSYFKLDPELGQASAKMADLVAHVSIPGDDERHPATERFPLFRSIFTLGRVTLSLPPAFSRLFGVPRLSVSFRVFSGAGDIGLMQAMDVRVGSRVWHKVDLRPARDSADPPAGFPRYRHVIYATNNPCRPRSEKWSVDFHRVLDLGAGLSHFHEQHDNRFGGELDNLSAATWKILGLIQTNLSTDDAYQFANGPIQDYGGWVDGTCIYYMLVQLKETSAIKPEQPETLRNAYAILWTDEQTAFTERWRLLELADSKFTSPFKPIVGVLAERPGEFYPGAPFQARRFWNPFAAGHVLPSSRMAVTRQIVVVSGRDPQSGRFELYSIHFAWPTMDRTWRWRPLPDAEVRLGDARPMAAGDVVYADTLAIREDSTILMRGSRMLRGDSVSGTWFQRYLPANGQEMPSAEARATEPENSKPQVGYAHAWDFVADPVFRVMHERFSHLGVYEPVRSRIQCYRVVVTDSGGLTEAEIEGTVWQDTKKLLQIKHFRLNWKATADYLDGKGPVDLTVANPTHPSLYNDPMSFRIVRRPGLDTAAGDWLLTHFDKRDDKLRAFDGAGIENALQKVELFDRARPSRSITIAVKSRHRNDVRQLHGPTVRAEQDEVSPPQVASVKLLTTLGPGRRVDSVQITLTLARDEGARHGYATFDEWLAVNLWRVKIGAIIHASREAAVLMPVLLYDAVRVGTFTRNDLELTATWLPGAGDQRNGLLADLLTADGRILYGTSVWFVGATCLACCADTITFATGPD